jgi:hypothetical protein
MIQAKNIDVVIKELKKKAIDLEGTENLAKECGTSLRYMRKVLIKHRPPTEEMLSIIGYELTYKKESQ